MQKWRQRASVSDARMGPKAIHSTVLTAEEEAMVVAFRRHTRLPLDDCLYALQSTIPHLTRSSLHRCLQRHGISRLPALEGAAAKKKRFKAYPIGYFHIDITEVRTEEGKLHLYVGVDRTSKFAFAQLHDKADRPTAVAFLEALIEAVPYNLHTILTDNGIQFADLPHNRTGPTARYRVHRFNQICREHGIEHRLTKPNHPWTNGQVERMNRTIKDEPHHQGRHRQALPLRQPRRAAAAPPALHRRLQPWPPAQDPARPHTLRLRRSHLDRRPKPIQNRSVSPHFETKHLG